MTARRFDALLLDIGDVISARAWDQFDELEKLTGRPLIGRGPLDPGGDRLWQRYAQGEITMLEYWEQYADLNGYPDWRDLFREMCAYLPERFGDPDAYELMAEARDAGYKVGVLTNDAVGINGTDFFTRIPEFQVLDAFVDAREFGSAKPDPETYLRAAGELDVAPERIVFLDDTQMCIDGAERVGMTAVRVDPLDKLRAFGLTRSLLGLSPSIDA